MSEATMESPLVLARRLDHGRAQPAAAGVRLGEQTFTGLVNLRGRPDDEGFTGAVKSRLGNLPTTPNTVSEHGRRLICWLGPDEWLILTPPGGETQLVDGLRQALEGQFAAVTDVTSGYTLITVDGPHSRDVLAKGCTLDLHPRVFAAGACAQSLVAKAGALLLPRDEARIDLVVRRSFADYLWRWLEDAAEEYGLAVL